MGLIRRSFTHLNVKTFCQLYKTIVRNPLEYAIATWCPAKIKDIEKLEGVQRRATKLLPGLRDLSYQDRLRQLQLPSLAYRRARGDMIETYKIITEKYDIEAIPNIQRANPDLATRGHTYKLAKIRSTTKTRTNFFTNRIVDPWNNLPQNIVSAPTLNSFKNRLDNHSNNQDILYDYKATIKSKCPPNSRMQQSIYTIDLDIQD